MSMLLEWLGFERIVLDSPLTHEECVRRLQEVRQANPSAPSTLKLRARRCLLLRRTSCFQIHKRRTFGRLSPLFISGLIRNDGTTTRIDAQLFYVSILIAGPGIAMPFYGLMQAQREGFPIAFFWALCALVVAGFVFLRPDVAKERRILLDFLRDTIGATEVRKRRRRR